jgi:hypothetical protein
MEMNSPEPMSTALFIWCVMSAWISSMPETITTNHRCFSSKKDQIMTPVFCLENNREMQE